MTRGAIVVGGGIGGLAAAIGLRRQGWDVRLFEQAPEFRPVGAGLSLAPNAMRAIDWLGLGDEFRLMGHAEGPAGIRTSSGRWLMRARLEDLRRRFGLPGLALHRADVHKILTAALPDAALFTGHLVTGVRTDDSGTMIEYQNHDGSGYTEADLVVGADGLHSRMRSVLFPSHGELAYAGYVTWRGVVPAEAAAGIELEEALTESWGRGKRFGIAPLPGGQVYWFAGVSLPAGTHSDYKVEDVAAYFRGWHEPIEHLLAATPRDSLLRHDIYYQDPPLPSYSSGRVVLLGDAAHAITPDLGQGACLALEDAAILSRAVTHSPTVEEGLTEYDRMRWARTQRLVRISALSGRVAQWRNPVLAAVRNTLAWVTPTSAYLRAVSDTFSWKP